MREAVSPQVSIDRLEYYMSGSIRKPRITPLGDLTRERNDCKPRILMDSPVSSTGVAILANEAIIVTTHLNEGLSL